MYDLPVNYRARSSEELQQAFEYAIRTVDAFLTVIDRCKISLEGLSMLEIGPGPDFGAQLVLASKGVRVTLADRFLAKWDPNFHPALYRMLIDYYQNANSQLQQAVADNGYENTSLVLVEEQAEALVSVPDGSMDFVYSNAVLEHVVNMKQVAEQIARVSKVGAWSAHQIDWRDHRDFSRPLEYLTMEDDEFRSEAEASHWEIGNRLRSMEFWALFESAGFEVVERETNSWTERNYFTEVLPRIRASSSSYSKWPEDDLVRIGGRIYARKLPEEGRAHVAERSADMISLMQSLKDTKTLIAQPEADVVHEVTTPKRGLLAKLFNA